MTLAEEVAAHEAVMDRLMTVYRAHMVQLCRQLGLTPPQLCAMGTIARLGRSKMSPLAEHLGLSMGAASTLVDRLATRGLIQRDADASDRRAVYVSLSPKGTELLEVAHKNRQELLTGVYSRLEPATRTALLGGLANLQGAWDALPTPGTTGTLSCLED